MHTTLRMLLGSLCLQCGCADELSADNDRLQSGRASPAATPFKDAMPRDAGIAGPDLSNSADAAALEMPRSTDVERRCYPDNHAYRWDHQTCRCFEGFHFVTALPGDYRCTTNADHNCTANGDGGA